MRLRYNPDKTKKKKEHFFKKGRSFRMLPLVQKAEFQDCMPALEQPLW
jgi:hypothetical protein